MTLIIEAPDSTWDRPLDGEKSDRILKREVNLTIGGKPVPNETFKDGTYLTTGCGEMHVKVGKQYSSYKITGIVDCENGAVEFLGARDDSIELSPHDEATLRPLILAI